MSTRPTQYAFENAEAFQDESVAAAYHLRPPYPPKVFEVLVGLITTSPRRVLDVGCGPGNIARHLVEYVDRVDAVDFSVAMIAQGKHLPNGDHPNLHWRHGRVEEVELSPPYALITAGASIHWLDWPTVLPRFREVLVPGGYLALVDHEVSPDPWSLLGEVVNRYRTDGGFQPYDLLTNLEAQGLFRRVGEHKTAPTLFQQSIDDYIESYHSRSGFSRERMGSVQAEAFDQAARQQLEASYPNGLVELQVVGRVIWGRPG